MGKISATLEKLVYAGRLELAAKRWYLDDLMLDDMVPPEADGKYAVITIEIAHDEEDTLWLLGETGTGSPEGPS